MDTSSALESDALKNLTEPKAIMMSDIFAPYWAHRIPRGQAQKLLSLDRKDPKSDPSNHQVIALPADTDEPLVFFKANESSPIQPEKEFMHYSLYRHFHIPVVETGLIILTNVSETNPENFYAVQASEAVPGASSLKACQDPETTFDHEVYVSQAIGAFLTNPSHGSSKDFQYSSKYQSLISINNGIVFQPELTGDYDRKMVNVKSILYLLPQIDLRIPDSVKTLFMTLDPDLTIFSWLKDLSQKNQDYQLLFSRLAFQRTRCIYQNLLPESEIPSLTLCLKEPVIVDPKCQNDSFYPQILVSQETLNCLAEKLQMIGQALRNNHSISTQGLFEEISPILGKFYRKLRLEFNDPKEAFEALCGKKKDNIDYSFLSSVLDLLEFGSMWGVIGLDTNVPPETFFKEYKDLLFEGQSPFDRFIKRHQERRKKNTLNPHLVQKELKFLIQEELINSQSIRDIVDFHHDILKLVENDYYLFKEIETLFSSLPHPELKWLFTLEKYFSRPDSSTPHDPSLAIQGVLMKQRTMALTESESQYLFDKQGNIRKNASLTGRSCVTCFPKENPEFYLKQYPEWPGYEFASTMFMRLLGVQNLPYQDLIIIKNYPVLLTQRVHGNPVLRVWHNPQAFNNLDPVHTALLIIAAMLINPEDGKEDNFILSPDGKYLIPIDNDHCFLPSTFQKKEGFLSRTVIPALQMKTLLFCLDEMKKLIPLEVKQLILSIDFDSLLKLWMSELDELEQKFNNLVSQEQRSRFLEQGTATRIPFYKQFIHNLHWKVHKIQEILKAVPEATPFDLLKSIEPFVARCYQDSFTQRHDLQSRFKAATESLYRKTAVDGSRMSILNTRTMIEILNVSEKDLLNDAIFQRLGPLAIIELLDQLIQERHNRAGREEEPLYEIEDKNLEPSLKAFSENPREGVVFKSNYLMTKYRLREVFTRAPHIGTKIRFFLLQNNPYLTYNKVRILAEECPNLEYLNVSGCAYLPQIFSGEGEWPLLTRLEAKDCYYLDKVVYYSPIKILRIGTSQKIEVFIEKPTLDVLEITNQANSFEFSFRKGEGFRIQALNQTLTNDNFVPYILQKTEEFDRYLRDFKVRFGTYSLRSENDLGAFITVLNLQNSNLKTQDIQTITKLKLRNLTRLVLSGNEIREAQSLEYLVQGDWPKLNYLDLSSNEINDDGLKILSFANWPLLETLDLTSTGITKGGVLDFMRRTNWPNLKEIIYNESTENFAKSLFAGRQN